MSLTGMSIAVLVLTVGFETYLLYLADKRIAEARQQNMDLLENCNKELKKQAHALDYYKHKAKELEAQIAGLAEANAQHKANARDLHQTISDWSKKYALLEQELSKMKAQRREAKLRKSVLWQNAQVKKAQAEEQKRQEELAERKRKFVKPHAINPHNPQKK